MIRNFEVKNFKSIKHLKLDCKRVNVFIGKPNTGKSNLLESLGMFSRMDPPITLDNFVRLETSVNLFYDQELNEKIEMTADDAYCKITFQNGTFLGEVGSNSIGFKFEFDYSGTIRNFSLEANRVPPPTPEKILDSYLPLRFYRFEETDSFPKRESDFLRPPFGENLLAILLSNKALKKVVADIFREYGLEIVLKPQEGKIEVQKRIEDVIISSPYSLVSDTLQRIVFYLAAIETNKDSIIIFEEPEAHAFPFYTKFLAERIGLDTSNQYFISTHNPYFLLPLLEKTPKDNIRVFIVYFENYQTKVKALEEKKLPEVLDLDASIFFNLDQFLARE